MHVSIQTEPECLLLPKFIRAKSKQKRCASARSYTLAHCQFHFSTETNVLQLHPFCVPLVMRSLWLFESQLSVCKQYYFKREKKAIDWQAARKMSFSNETVDLFNDLNMKRWTQIESIIMIISFFVREIFHFFIHFHSESIQLINFCWFNGFFFHSRQREQHKCEARTKKNKSWELNNTISEMFTIFFRVISLLWCPGRTCFTTVREINDRILIFDHLLNSFSI